MTKKDGEKISPINHYLIPKHVKLSEKEKKELFERYNISNNELPKIIISDPAIAHLDVQTGDIVKVIRNSATAKEAMYYRAVING